MILSNANVFTATPEPIRHDTSIRIEEGRIVGIGVQPNEDERIVDLSGKWVTPGFVDAHVHLTLDGLIDPYDHEDYTVPELTVIALKNAHQQLQAGFTTVRDCGSRANIDVGIRNIIEQSGMSGPRIIAGGKTLAVTGGHGSFLGGWELDGANEFRHAARANIRDGVDFIKVIATGGVLTEGSEPGARAVTRDELAAVIDEAHRADCQVAVHAHGAEGIEVALEMGVDTVEHCTYATNETLDQFEASSAGYVSTIISTVVQTTEEAISDGIRPYVTEKATEALEAQLETFRAAQDRDIPILLGTDAGTPRNPHGTGAREFEQFVENGFSEADALKAATIEPAKKLGLADEVGTIELGKVADLVVLPDNPLSDITVTQRPDMIIKDGHKIMNSGEIQW